jgi:hypothetical protein
VTNAVAQRERAKKSTAFPAGHNRKPKPTTERAQGAMMGSYLLSESAHCSRSIVGLGFHETVVECCTRSIHSTVRFVKPIEARTVVR